MTPLLELVMWHDVLALNRLTRFVVMAALVFAAYTAVRWAANQPVFAIRAITVSNAQNGPLNHVQATQVAQFCVPRLTGTLFTNDIEATRAAFEALPWVHRATVRRQWPNRLLVTLEEHRALARWNDADGNRFVSVAGEAFNAPGEKTIGAALPLLLGPEGSEKEVAVRYEEFRERLSAIAKTPALVALSPRQAWTIKLANHAVPSEKKNATPNATVSDAVAAHEGLTLDLGREQPRSSVLSRLERFTAHYSATLGRFSAHVEAVDLRYPNGFAARIPGFRATAAPASKPARNLTPRKPAVTPAAKPARGRA